MTKSRLSFVLKVVVFIFCMWLNASLSFAKSVKSVAGAQNGCISELSLENANAAIFRFRLVTVNATDEEIIALGKGLIWIENLNSGLTPAWATNQGPTLYPIEYLDEDRSSEQLADRIKLRRRGAQNLGQNVAQVMHEFGHFVGNQSLYKSYNFYVGTEKCFISDYSKKNANERFAEVFAAFITTPNLIQQNLFICSRTWSFFQNLFSQSDLAYSCQQKLEDNPPISTDQTIPIPPLPSLDADELFPTSTNDQLCTAKGMPPSLDPNIGPCDDY